MRILIFVLGFLLMSVFSFTSVFAQKPDYQFFGATNSGSTTQSYDSFAASFSVSPTLYSLLLLADEQTVDYIDGRSLIAVPLDNILFGPTGGTKPECSIYGNPGWQFSSTRLPDWQDQLVQLFIDKPWLLTKVDFFIIGNEMNNQCLLGTEIDEIITYLKTDLDINTPVITGLEFGQAGLDLPPPGGYPLLIDIFAPFNYSTEDPLINTESNAELNEILAQGKPIILIPPAFYNNGGPYGHDTWFPFNDFETLADGFYSQLLKDWRDVCMSIEECIGVVPFGYTLPPNPNIKTLSMIPDFNMAQAIMPFNIPQFTNNFTPPTPPPPTPTPPPTVNMVLDINPDTVNPNLSVVTITGAPLNTVITVRYKWNMTGAVDCFSNIAFSGMSDSFGAITFPPVDISPLPPSTIQAFTQDCSEESNIFQWGG